MKVSIYHPWAGLPARRKLHSRMASHGLDVSFVLPNVWIDEFNRKVVASVEDPEVGDTHRLAGVPVLCKRSIPLHFVVGRLTRVFNGQRPDLIYAYHEPYAVATSQVVRAGETLGLPTIVRSSQNLAKRYPYPVRRAEARVHARVSGVVVTSPSIERVLRSKGYSGRTEIVPMSVDLSVFRLQGDSSSVAGVTDARCLRILFVGRLVPEKGLETVLRALQCLKNARLRVAGTGRDYRRLIELAEMLRVSRQIEWLGGLGPEALVDEYNSADVVVVPSLTYPHWAEQFGRVVLESGACGTPCVVSDSGELPAVVDSLSAGWTFREGDAHDLVEKILEAHKFVGIAQRQQLRQSVGDLYGESVVAGQLARALKDFAGV